jgi:hypothetical protein
MKKKIFSVFVALLVVTIVALPLSSVAANKESLTLEGFFATFIYYGTAPSPGPGPFAYAQPAGKSTHMNPAGFKDLPVVFEGDIAAGTMTSPGVGWPYAVVDEDVGGTYNAHWLMKNYLNPDVANEIKITGFIYLEDAEVEGVGVGDLTIKLVEQKLAIVKGTGDLKGLEGTGTLTSANPFWSDYIIEAHINEKLIH